MAGIAGVANVRRDHRPVERRQSKTWIATVNNYNDEDIARIVDLWPENLSYYIFGRKRGEGGTPHLQCYFQFLERKRCNQVRALLPLGAHITRTVGSADENMRYCSKEGNFSTEGTPISQGERSDIHALKKMGRLDAHQNSYLSIMDRYG